MFYADTPTKLALAAVAAAVGLVLMVYGWGLIPGGGGSIDDIGSADSCYLVFGGCPLQNGWDGELWLVAVNGAKSSGLSGRQASCVIDVAMAKHTPQSFVSLSVAELEELGVEAARDECRSLFS